MTEIQMQSNPDEQNNAQGKRWSLIFVWLLVAVLLLVVGLQLWKAQLGVVGVGEVAPKFSLTLFDGEEITPADMEGKVVLVNFWASWCIPCEDEAYELQSAWEYYQGNEEVLFVGVDYSDTNTAALEFLDKFGVTYPNGPDLGTRISQDYRMQGVPETFIIDQEGIIAYVLIGPFQSVEQITTIIDALLGS
ncbi:MAG: TlpA family protein disulfide reductase [Chloroflexi bacterium]|nr:TlpA family protein disulfide reductase [Chloroflexota bacterium]